LYQIANLQFSRAYSQIADLALELTFWLLYPSCAHYWLSPWSA